MSKPKRPKPEPTKQATPPAKPERSGRTFSEVSPELVPEWAHKVVETLNRNAKAGVETP